MARNGEEEIPAKDLGLLLFSRQVVSDFVTPWTAARQASLSFTISWSLLRLMSVESVMPSNHLILCCHPLLLPSIFPSFRSFPIRWLFTSGGQSISQKEEARGMDCPCWRRVGETVPIPLLYLQYPAQCPAQSRCSVNPCLVNE